MKKMYFLLVVLFCINVHAQNTNDNQTLLNKNETETSFFFSPMMNFSSLNGQFLYSIGAGGAILMNNFFIGGFGYFKTNSFTIQSEHFGNESLDLDMFYGGIWSGYSFVKMNVIRPNILVYMAYGRLTSREDHNDSFKHSTLENDESTYQEFYSLTPQFELEVNITPKLAIAAGINYRIVFGADETIYGLSNYDLSGIGGNLRLKIVLGGKMGMCG